MASGLWRISALGTLFAMASAGKNLDIVSSGAFSAFATNIFSTFPKSFGDRNVVISPVSLHPVLAMVEMGAKELTKEQLLNALGLRNHALHHIDVDWAAAYSELNRYLKDPSFTTASALFCASDIVLKTNYLEKVGEIGASFKRVDFTNGEQASATINDWVNTATHGKITKLYEPNDLTEDTALVIANAIHFKDDWVYKFNAAEMKDFHSPNGIIQLPMMYRQAKFLYGEHPSLDAQVVALPYKTSTFKMLIILPTKGTSLDDIRIQIKEIGLDRIWKSLKKRKVKVEIPKFTIESELELTDNLRSMGIIHLFDRSRADLSVMAEDLGNHDRLYVSDVKQKVIIEVNEEGTEAAAATGSAFTYISLPFAVKSVIADRPFIFSLCAEGVPLISGKMFGNK